MPFFSNYTLQDIIGIFLGVVLFPVIIVIPGYVAGWFLDLFDFRLRQPIVRFQIGLILSISISPILFFLMLRFFSQFFAYGTILVSLILFVAILYHEPRSLSIVNQDRQNNTNRFIKYALWISLGWIVFVTIMLTEFQTGDRLYFNVVAHDFSSRVAIINAITRTGIPPVNPSYFPGHPVYLTYLYYFWYVLCSLIDQVGGKWIDAREAMVASVVWCGLSLMATAALYLRLRNPGGSVKTWKSALRGVGLVFISGADIIPVLMISSVQKADYLEGDIEHWNEQITAWIGSLAWAPHHVAAMIACLVGVMLLLQAQKQSSSDRRTAMIIAGLAFASAFGLSVFVTIVFAIFWGIWLIICLIQKNWGTVLVMLIPAVVGLIAISPFLLDLIGNSNSGSASIPLTIAVRAFWPVGIFIQGYPTLVRNVIYLLALPINYFLELGFFFIAGFLWLQHYSKGIWKQNPFFVAEIIILATSVLVGSFVRSTVILSNDIGWRAWLPGQFILLIWGVDIIERAFNHNPHGKRPLSPYLKGTSSQLKVFLIIGLLTTLMDIVFLRAWPFLVDSDVARIPNSFSMDKQLGKRTFAARQAYEYMNENLPADTVIQINPTDKVDRTIGLYANRQVAISVHTAFGISEQELERKISIVSSIFKEENWRSIDEACNNNFITTLVVNDLDELWNNLADLEKQRAPLYKNQYYAVFRCGR